jgi:hypothetical protein
MSKVVCGVVLAAVLAGASAARAGDFTIVASELKDGLPIGNANTQTFSAILTTKAGNFVIARLPNGTIQKSNPNPRFNVAFIPPSTFVISFPDNDLIPAGTDVDITLEARLSGRVAAQPVRGLIATANSTLTIAFPEIPPCPPIVYETARTKCCLFGRFRR